MSDRRRSRSKSPPKHGHGHGHCHGHGHGHGHGHDHGHCHDKPCNNKDCQRKLEEAQKEIERLRKELEECKRACQEAEIQCEKEKEELREKIKELEANQCNCSCVDGPGGETGSWVTASDGEVPAGAVEGGYDAKEKFYVARSAVEDHVLPGKLHPSNKCCWVPYDNAEVRNDTYEVLVEEGCTWVAMTSSQKLPSKSVVGGYMMKDGVKETLFIGRANFDTTRLVPGYVFSSSKELLIAHSHKNVTKSSYEILIKL